MKILDISMPISKDMQVYKGRESKKPHITTQTDFSTASAFESRIDMNMHTGTHLDTPLHIFEDGSTVENLSLSKVVTECKVFDFTDADDRVSKTHLETKQIEKGDFILLKTKNSIMDLLEGDFVFLDKYGAEYLRDKGVIGVGIDSLGIERSQPEHETHKLLLGSDIVILEGLRLGDIDEGEYLLVAAPILIEGAEAAPVRAMLISDL